MSKEVLAAENVKLNVAVASREEAIRLAGRLLVDNGYVNECYIDSMLEREALTTTFMGNMIAIPHGTDESKQEVLASGISILQIPDGVDFGKGNVAKVVFGIAGKGDGHLELLSKIAILCSEVENVEKIVAAESFAEIVQLFEDSQ
ncbi:MAG: PTS sugar transporter subunit IIA [Turicibacter sp.]|nr:PTS sugar transporter subunit IIA [Turicibacter sp.]